MNHTPEDFVRALEVQNKKIWEGLEAEDLDSEQLLLLVSDRDALVNECLNLLSGEEKKLFAELEQKVNAEMVTKIAELRKEAKHSLSKFVKDAKAVRKYR